MEERVVIRAIDRTGWPSGTWDEEPDRHDFISSGFSCMLLRGPVGAWCGYVGVPSDHVAYGKDYEHVDVDVHGGLTYAHKCNASICHVPEPGMPGDVWWLGFDTAHCGDMIPGLRRFDGLFSKEIPGWEEPSETYRDMQWTKRETQRLARQLSRMRRLALSPAITPDAVLSKQ